MTLSEVHVQPRYLLIRQIQKQAEEQEFLDSPKKELLHCGVKSTRCFFQTSLTAQPVSAAAVVYKTVFS